MSLHSLSSPGSHSESALHKRGKCIRPGLPCTLAPTEHPPLLNTILTMTEPSPVLCLGLLFCPEGLGLPLTCGDSFTILGAGGTGLNLLTVGAAAAHMTSECRGWRKRG